jgi:antitoxin (DNA-binding transcriptional repressor) of toxin-antitoxin stability system
LSDILNRARYKGETFIIQRNGEPVAKIEPPPKVGITLRELAELLRDLPALDEDFEKDVESARSILRDPSMPEWPN